MATVTYTLSPAIPLHTMIPAMGGGVAVVPPAIPLGAGIYMICNLNTNSRYAGISGHMRRRFGTRQGSCFSLGFSRANLMGVSAYCGTVGWKNHGDAALAPDNVPGGYQAANMRVKIDHHRYDLEHLMIKAMQYQWPIFTCTNTDKTGPLRNKSTRRTITVRFSLGGVVAAPPVTLAPGATWA